MIIFKRSQIWCCEGEGGGQGNGGDDGGAPQITAEVATQVLGQWRDHLPEDLATDSTLEGFNGKGFADVVKGYSSLARKLGKNPIVRPGEKATDQDWSDFYSALGRPEDGDGYELGAPEGAPDGWKYNDNTEKAARQLFHDAGLTADQAKKLWSGFMKLSTDSYSEAMNQHSGFINSGHEELKREWGKEYGARTKGAMALAAELGLDGYLKQTGLSNNPKLIRALGEIWNSHYREGDLGGSGGSPMLSSREAKSKIADIKATKDHPYFDVDHPGHKKAVDEMTTLYEIAYAEE